MLDLVVTNLSIILSNVNRENYKFIYGDVCRILVCLNTKQCPHINRINQLPIHRNKSPPSLDNP